MTDESIPLSDLCSEYFSKEIDAGFKVTDNTSFQKLKRKCIATLKVKRNSNSMVKDVLCKILKEKGIAIPKPDKIGGGIEADFKKEPLLPTETETQRITIPQEITNTSSAAPTEPIRSLLPKTESTGDETTKTPFIPNPQEREKQATLAQNSIGGVIQVIFERLSILEPRAKPKDEIEKLEQSEKLRVKIDSFSNKLGGKLYDKGIKLPSVLEYVDIGIEGYEAILSPLLSKMGGGTDQEPAPEKTEEEKKREEALKDA